MHAIPFIVGLDGVLLMMPRPAAKVSVRASDSLLELEPIICSDCTFLAAEEVTSSTAFPLDSRREGEREKRSAGERGDKERGIGGARESECERGSKVLSWQEAVNKLFHDCRYRCACQPVCLNRFLELRLTAYLIRLRRRGQYPAASCRRELLLLVQSCPRTRAAFAP
jgi:hypothetical protein